MDLRNAVWRTATGSSAVGENCVEVAALNLAGVVAIRDSKNPSSHVIVLPAVQWRRFRRAVSGA